MTVSLSSWNILQPNGELDVSLFASQDEAEAMIVGWITDAIARVANVTPANQQEAAAAWVYYRAFGLLAQRYASTASTIMVDGVVTRSTSSDQRKFFDDRMKFWQDVFAGLSAVTSTSAEMVFFNRVRARPDQVFPCY